MNTGIVVSRYATALLRRVEETGSGEVVLHQIQTLLAALNGVSELECAIDDPAVVSSEQKVALLKAVLADSGPASMAPELQKFVALLIRNGRICDIRLIFRGFESLYYESRGIVRGRLVLAGEVDDTGEIPLSLAVAGHSRHPVADTAEKLEERFRNIIEEKTGKRLMLTTEVDPSLLGGFVFETEDQLLDASVSHQLDLIKKQFLEKNRRIV